MEPTGNLLRESRRDIGYWGLHKAGRPGFRG